jgi:hypothetical protein
MLLASLALLFLCYPVGYLLGLPLRTHLCTDPWAAAGARLLLGLAFWPALVAVATALGLRLSGTAAVALAAGLALAALAVALRRDPRPRPRLPKGAEAWTMLALLGLSFCLRWWQARGVAWPLWGDAINHTAATMLVIEHGGIPPNWGRFIPTSSTFSYHFGFHVWAALLHWLTGMEPWWAVFWLERVLNAFAPLSIYLLSQAIFGEPQVSFWAAAIVAFSSKMPQYYINWSRDTQLGGQTLLPLVAFLFGLAIRRQVRAARVLPLLALATAALMFVHYRIFVFAFAFLAGMLALARFQQAEARLAALEGCIGAALGVLAASPWLWRVLSTQRLVASQGLTWHSPEFAAAYFGVPAIAEYCSPALLLFAALGAATCLILRPRQGIALLASLAILIVAANGYRLRLRGLDLINFTTLWMGLYLFLAPAAGFLLSLLVRALRLQPRARLALVLALVAIGFAAYGRIVDERYVLVRPEDVRLFAWVKEHIPPQARILVNTFPVSASGRTIAGPDAGWWLTIVSGHETNLPVLTYVAEVVSPRYVEELMDLSQLGTDEIMTDAGHKALCEHSVGYIFLGAVGGRLDGEALLRSGRYPLLQAEGRAMIFAVPCPG